MKPHQFEQLLVFVRIAVVLGGAAFYLWGSGIDEFTSFSQCRAQAVNTGGWKDFREFGRWCQKNAGDQENKSFVKSVKLWMNSKYVNQCNDYVKCRFWAVLKFGNFWCRVILFFIDMYATIVKFDAKVLLFEGEVKEIIVRKYYIYCCRKCRRSKTYPKV